MSLIIIEADFTYRSPSWSVQSCWCYCWRIWRIIIVAVWHHVCGMLLLTCHKLNSNLKFCKGYVRTTDPWTNGEFGRKLIVWGLYDCIYLPFQTYSFFEWHESKEIMFQTSKYWGQALTFLQRKLSFVELLPIDGEPKFLFVASW